MLNQSVIINPVRNLVLYLVRKLACYVSSWVKNFRNRLNSFRAHFCSYNLLVMCKWERPVRRCSRKLQKALMRLKYGLELDRLWSKRSGHGSYER